MRCISYKTPASFVRFGGARASALTGVFARCGIECRASGKVDVLPGRGGTARSAAAHRRAAPTARRLSLSARIAPKSRASVLDKVRLPIGWIAAPRPGDARLLSDKGSDGSFAAFQGNGFFGKRLCFARPAPCAQPTFIALCGASQAVRMNAHPTGVWPTPCRGLPLGDCGQWRMPTPKWSFAPRLCFRRQRRMHFRYESLVAHGRTHIAFLRRSLVENHLVAWHVLIGDQ